MSSDASQNVCLDGGICNVSPMVCLHITCRAETFEVVGANLTLIKTFLQQLYKKTLKIFRWERDESVEEKSGLHMVT